MNDEMMLVDFILSEGFWLQLDRLTDIGECRVALATENKIAIVKTSSECHRLWQKNPSHPVSYWFKTFWLNKK